MNIFYLHTDPKISARAMTNKHCVKMILESAQLLSTAHWVLDPDTPFANTLYKVTHQNHPSSIWVRESSANYNWLYAHFVELCKEYTRRYGKTHLTESKLMATLGHFPANIPMRKATPVRLAITNPQYHKADPVMAYRMYYVKEKIKTKEDLDRYMRVLKGE